MVMQSQSQTALSCLLVALGRREAFCRWWLEMERSCNVDKASARRLSVVVVFATCESKQNNVNVG